MADEWSEAEKQQATMRLVRLDAEGNPVDGTVRYLKVKDLKFFQQPEDIKAETVDDYWNQLISRKSVTVTIPLTNVDEQTLKLLKGEDADSGHSSGGHDSDGVHDDIKASGEPDSEG
jgi:hypothetical protein